jgi:ABC-type sulfate/molybdate transport systems ATPase subunit/ABC-type sulfate transport system permease component
MTRAGRPAWPKRLGPLPWLAALLVAYLAVPVAVFLFHSAANPAGFGTPGLFAAIGTSLASATVSVGVLALLGVPLAYLLARGRGPVAALAGAAAQLPLALPPLMSGVVLLYVFGPNTWLGQLSGGRFTESLLGIVLAQSFVSAPFLVTAARSAFRAVDANLPEMAATAGLGPFARFARVELPLAAPGIRAGLLLAWLRAFGEYGATVMLSYHPFSLPVFTYVQFSATGLPAAQAPALLSIAVAASVIAFSRARLGRLLSAAVAGRGGGRRAFAKASGPTKPASPPLQRPVAVAFRLSAHAGDFSLELSHQASSHRLAIVGPSGAGKSLTLRALAGLAPGEVYFGGKDVCRLAPERRQVGYLPQGESLLPDRSAWENAMLGPYADPGLARWWFEALGISHLAGRFPRQMSGGQRQRVALARALSGRPELVLLDEPFTGLDAPVRGELVRLLRRLQLAAGFSSVLVTHDMSEAALLAEEVLIISGGRALQAGPVAEVLRRPRSPEVARLVGFGNILPGVALSPEVVLTAGQAVHTGYHGLATGTAVAWCVRPRDVVVSAVPAEGACAALVVDAADLGDRWALTLSLNGKGGKVLVEAETPRPPAGLGEECFASFPEGAVMVWPVGTGGPKEAAISRPTPQHGAEAPSPRLAARPSHL